MVTKDDATPTQDNESGTDVTADRIEKRMVLKAPQSRVWRAIANAQEFGAWFQMKLNGAFEQGVTISGNLTYPGYEHLQVAMEIECIDPERFFSYRWHPGAIDPAIDYSNEPTTLVEFMLEPDNGGTILTITESGFDRIPLARRAEAFRMDDAGWTEQLQNIDRYVTSD